MSAHKTTLLLGVILVVAAGLRVWNFGFIAPANSDEATYLRQARFMATLGRKALGFDVPVVAPEQRGIWRYVRKSDWSEKPCWLHAALMAVPMLFVGPSDAAGAVTNILFSLAGVWLTFMVCKQFFIPPPSTTGRELKKMADVSAAIAAALLAVCFYWLLYSRGFWAEVDAAVFVLLAFYLLGRGTLFGSRRMLLVALAGVATALAVLCHYRLLYVIGPMVLLAGIWSGKKAWLVSVLAVLAGFAGCLLLAAAVFRLGAMFASGGVPFTGLLGALWERYFPGPGGIEQKGLQFANLYAYGRHFVRNMGICLSALAFAGLIGICGPCEARTQKGVAGAALLAVAPFIVLIFQVWVVARAIVVSVPFACILAGYAFSAVFRFPGPSGVAARILAGLLVLGALAENLRADIRLIGNRMGHKTVAEFLRREKPPVVYADRESAIIYGWYAPELRYETLRALRETPPEKILPGACAVFDAQKWHTYPVVRKLVGRFEAEIAKRINPVLTVPNLTTMWQEFLLDGTQAHKLGDMLESVTKAAKAGDIFTIRVYRLKATAQQQTDELKTLAGEEK